jgi:hypothetical protein
MKRILITTLLVLGLIGCALMPPPDEPMNRNSIEQMLKNAPRKTRSRDSYWDQTGRAFATEKSADVVVEYSSDGAMGICPPTPADGIQPNPEREYEPTQLIKHFDSQSRKNLVVVIIAKQTWSDEQLKSEISKLNRYFFARGYERVVIQQGLGGGRGTHSDLRRPTTS